MKYIIIGGVAGGATAATRIRRIDEKAQIIIIEKGSYISYANCGLPYYIGDVIEDRNKLLLQTPESFKKRFNIDVRIKNEVISINNAEKSVKIVNDLGQEYIETYDKLLISTGSTPIKPNLDGINTQGIFTLRSIEDSDKIKKYIQCNTIKRATIVGGGFIGLEMAENLHSIGAEISIIELGNQIMNPIDFSMAQHVHHHLVDKGVNLYLNNGVKGFKKEDNNIKVLLNDNSSISTDLVILSIGVRPESSLARLAGIKIGETGGIYVDEYLQTSEKDIYAVGDAVEFPHPITGKPWLNYLANPANRQGRLVADNMVLGHTQKYEGAIGTSIAKVFDLTVATTGLPAKKLKQLGIDYESSYTQSSSHAGYYPDAFPLFIKLTFNKVNGLIYGAQIIGSQGVDKRIDQISLLIKNGATVYDLTRIEHAYAPPFSSAKDPITIAGYVASNIISGAMPIIHWCQIEKLNTDNTFILDVRTPEEFSFGHIKGAINIPLDEIRENIDKLPVDKNIVIYCAVGLRGYFAQKILFANGFSKVKNLSGGYKHFANANYLITNPILHKTETKNISKLNQNTTLKIDACGLSCPGPIIKVKQAIDTLNNGDIIEITSTDAGFSRDAVSWCKSTGNTMISKEEIKGKFIVTIQKGSNECCPIQQEDVSKKGKTFIMFSDDLDKALATMVLANGAAATGAKVTIFFTFWGLNVIKKIDKPATQKDIFGKMFSMMLPSNSLKLSLSKMSMFGIGDKMMRYIMKQKNIESLETLRQEAINQGVEFIACQMSMDVMGVNREDLLDNVTVGGVATYMERADNANVNLFI